MTDQLETISAMLDERGVEYDKVTENGRTTFNFNYAEKCCDYLNEISVVGECITASKAYLIPEQAIVATLGNEINGETSDGYHTFNELYHHRAVLFSVVVAANSGRAWKSKLHHDGTMYEGMFIVGVDTPQGQATYHYDVEPYWDMFWCKELERAPEWDGHTPDDAIERIGSLRDVVFKGPRGRR